MGIREELYKKLIAPFPDRAYSADRTRSRVLTSLKAQYVVERLNEVFGIGYWSLSGEWKEVEDGVIYFGQLMYTFKDDNEELTTLTTEIVPGFAGVDHASTGDAYKSSRTDCLSKSASYIGVGNDMYKGLIDPPLSGNNVKNEKQENEAETEEEPKTSVAKPSKFKARKFKRSETEEEEGYVDAGEAEEEDSDDEAQPKTPAKLKSVRMFKRKSSFKKKGD